MRRYREALPQPCVRPSNTSCLTPAAAARGQAMAICGRNEFHPALNPGSKGGWQPSGLVHSASE